MTWTIETGELSCHRCQGELYLSVRLPHEGFPPPPSRVGVWTRSVPLCPVCDVNDANAHSLLAFFAVYSQVDDANAAEFAQLVQDWVRELPPAEPVSAEVLDAEIAAWRAGEYDAD